MHNYYLVWLLMWAFLFLCVLQLNWGFSKKLVFFPLLSVFTFMLYAASVEAGLLQTHHNISLCSNYSETLRRSSVEHFHKLCKATLRTNPKLVTNLGKVGVCV